MLSTPVHFATHTGMKIIRSARFLSVGVFDGRFSIEFIAEEIEEIPSIYDAPALIDQAFAMSRDFSRSIPERI